GSYPQVLSIFLLFFFFFQAEDGIRDLIVTGVQTCALPIYRNPRAGAGGDDYGAGFDPLALDIHAERAGGEIRIDDRPVDVFGPRSEERRVGKECRCRWSREY